MKERHTINKANITNPVFLSLGITLLLSSCATVFETATQAQAKPEEIIAQQILEDVPVSPNKTVQQANNEPSLENAKERSPQQPAKLANKAFPEEVLYQLLVADIALIRGQFEPALEKYLQQARETRDIEIIAMANRIASHQGDIDVALETAELWLELMPDHARAHRAALNAHALRNDPLEALRHAYWLYLNEDDIEAFLAVTAINEGAKQELIAALIEAYQNLSLGPEKQPSVKLAVAILHLESGQLEVAVETAEDFLLLAPDNQRGLLFLAQTLHQQDRVTEALSLLKGALQRMPDNTNLRLQYARFLTLTDRPQAITQFEILRLKESNNQQINFLLALLYLNQGNIAPAIRLFNQASSDPSLYADAHFHLGSIANNNGDAVSALQHYQQVHSGRNYLAAASRSARLMAQQQNINSARSYLQQLRAEQPRQSPSLFQVESNLLLSTDLPDQAFNLLTLGLQTHPGDKQLLYARSMIAELMGNFELAEEDLRALLAQDANNSTALNALGYTMILHSDRLEEAHKLIKRAYLLNPGDPAILDSMGWVIFMLGDAQQALPYLEKAMAIMADPEIAAHLGEVQWSLGNRQAAMQIWNQAIELAPEHQTIKETMQRLLEPLDREAFDIESTQNPIDKSSVEPNS
jgi:predicted Zn-dependent protease